MAPVDSTGITHRLATTRQRFSETRIHLQRRWPLEQPIVQLAQTIRIDRRIAAARARLAGFGFLRRIVGIPGRSRIDRIVCDPDLIVEDDVECSACTITIQSGEIERLGYDSFARKRRVAVNADWENRRLVPLPASRQNLPRSRDS